MTNLFRARDWADDMPPIRNQKGHVDHLAHRVLQHLARRAKPDGTDAYPAVAAMANRLGVERREIRRALEALEKLGLILDCGESDYGSTIWHLQVKDAGLVTRLALLERERTKTLSQANAARQAKHRSRRGNSEESVTNAASAVTSNSEESVTSNSEGGVTSQRGRRYVTARAALRNAASAPRTNTYEQTPLRTDPKNKHCATSPAQEEAPVALLNFNDLPYPSSPAPPAKTTKPRKTRPVATDDPDFDKVWAAYDYKTGKLNAQKAWAKALAKGVQPETILAAIPAYVATTRKPSEPEGKTLRAHLATWLNAERWEDEIVVPTGYQGKAGSDARPPEEYVEMRKHHPVPKLLRAGVVGSEQLCLAWYYHFNHEAQRGWTVEQIEAEGNTRAQAQWLHQAYSHGIDPELYQDFFDATSLDPDGAR